MTYETISLVKRKNAPGQGGKDEGRTVSSIGMLPGAWNSLDQIRGKHSGGKAVEKILNAFPKSSLKDLLNSSGEPQPQVQMAEQRTKFFKTPPY